MSKAREAAGQTLIVLAGRGAGVGVSLAAVIFQTRYLTPQELALVPVIGVLTELCAVFGDLGLGLAVERRLPGLMERDAEAAVGLIGTFVYTVLATTTLYCIGIYLMATALGASLLKDGATGGLIALAIPAMIAGVWRNHLFMLMRGTRHFGRLSVFSLTFQVTWTLTSIAFFLIWGIRGFVIGLAAGPLVPCLWETILLRRYLPRPPSGGTWWRFVKMAWPFNAERYVNYWFVYADQWIIGLMLNPVALATYYVPRRFFDQLLSILDGFWMVPTAALSREAARGPEVLARSLSAFKRVFIYLFTPMAVGLAAGSFFIIDVLAGAKYHAGVYPFAILCVFFLVSGVFAPQTISVAVVSPPRHRLYSLILQNVSFVVLLPALAYVWDLNGVATARVLGSLILAAASCWFIGRVVRLPMERRAFRAILLPSAALLLLGVGGQWLHYSRPAAAIFLVAAGLAYIVVFVRYVCEEDLAMIEHLLPGPVVRRKAWWRGLRPSGTVEGGAAG